MSLRVEGLDAELREPVVASIALQKAIAGNEKNVGLLRRLHRRAPDEIRKALQALGYYSPLIEADLDGEIPDAQANYRVQAGPPTLISAVDLQIEGDPGDDLQRVRKRLPVKVGERLVHSDYETAKTELLRAAYRNGYLDAELLEHRLLVNPEQRNARIELRLSTGPQYRFGPLTLEQEILDEDVLLRYLEIEQGAIFDSQKLVDARFRLTDLGYFSSIEVIAVTDHAVDREVPIRISAQAASNARYRIGLGYGTDTGARLTTGASFKRINRRGHRLNTDLRLSEVASRTSTEYVIPLGSEIGEQLGFSIEYSDQLIADIDTRKFAVGTALVRSPGDWQRQLYLRFERELFDIDGDTQATNLLIPGLSLSRTRIDDPVRARKGWSVFGDVHGAARNVGSDNGFIQGLLQARLVFPLFERSRLLLRGESGGTIVESFSQLPPSQRFFAGGDQSVRGYAYQSLGPRDENNNVIGGEYLLTGSAEIEVPVWGNWGAAVFADAGGTDDKPAPELSRSVGAGARWISPIGTLQIDLAHPLDGDKRGVRLHVGIRVGL